MLVGNAGLVFAPRPEEPVPIASQVEEAIAQTQSIFQPLPARLPAWPALPDNNQSSVVYYRLSAIRFTESRSPETQPRP